MAQVKLLKIDASEGIPLEMDTSADEITLASFGVTGGGPILSATGLDLNNQDVSDVKNLDFNDPSSATIDQTAGALIVDDLMFQTKENAIAVGASILFPVITDVADSVDAFRVPSLAGVPTASPSDGGSGYLVFDDSNNDLYLWDGAAWDNLSTVTQAETLGSTYTAGELIAANDAVYISANDTVSIADNTVAKAKLIGFVPAGIAAAAAGTVQKSGVLSGFSAMTAGNRMYLGAAGSITSTVPVGTGNVIVQAGYAKNVTDLEIQIIQLGRRA